MSDPRRYRSSLPCAVEPGVAVRQRLDVLDDSRPGGNDGPHQGPRLGQRRAALDAIGASGNADEAHAHLFPRQYLDRRRIRARRFGLDGDAHGAGGRRAIGRCRAYVNRSAASGPAGGVYRYQPSPMSAIVPPPWLDVATDTTVSGARPGSLPSRDSRENMMGWPARRAMASSRASAGSQEAPVSGVRRKPGRGFIRPSAQPASSTICPRIE